MQRVIEDRIREDDFRFIQDIWADWSPGYPTDEDMAHVREALPTRTICGRRSATTGAVDPTRFGSPEWAAEQEAAWGGGAPQPVLYLHGTTDGCHGVTKDKVERVKGYAGPGSEAELIEGVGHFLMVERPTRSTPGSPIGCSGHHRASPRRSVAIGSVRPSCGCAGTAHRRWPTGASRSHRQQPVDCRQLRNPRRR